MAFDAFLKLDGIPGETTDKQHPGEIQVDSFSWGVENASSRGSGGGQASVQDFSFRSPVSKASPLLMLACATGKHIPTALITLRKAGFEFIKIRLDDVLVSSYQTGGVANDGAERPEDSFSLAFVKIDFLYTVQRTGEVVETVFDTSVGPAG
jgi:type VI secretion system secreted protein Hcp